MRIAFDLWGTLIRANPEFRTRRVDLFQKHFPDEPVYEIYSDAMDTVKKQLNNIIEPTGWMPNAKLIRTFIAASLNTDEDSVYRFMQDYQRLAILYPPTFIDPDTPKILNWLAKDHGLYIISNTMFIEGDTLTEILKQKGVDNCFKGYAFSDNQKISKPNPAIFSYDLDYMVGDNTQTDGGFALAKNTKFIHINSNDKTLKDAYDIITSNR